MVGSRDDFSYFECSKCGCLQIAEIPQNMEKYYSSNYYSFQKITHRNFLKRLLVTKRDQYVLFKTGTIGKLLSKKYPNDVLELISKSNINIESRVLDVGCGSGGLLFLLKSLGMRNLVGVDPYVREEIKEQNIRILKATIHVLPDEQKFDLVVFNHSFEHIPDQLATLSKACGMLSKSGVCLLRIPLKTDHIWNLYGIDWVQIDAPRHFFIHTMRSLRHLADKAELLIKDVVFDSTEFQFWGSEQYKKDIPLTAENSYAVSPRKSIFTPRQIAEFKKIAGDLNKTNRGDQAVFYLTKR